MISVLAKIYIEEMGLANLVASGHERAVSIIKRAEMAAADIEARWHSMRTSGELQGVNRAYQRERMERKAHGEPMLSYAVFSAAYKARLMRLLCREVCARSSGPSLRSGQTAPAGSAATSAPAGRPGPHQPERGP